MKRLIISVVTAAFSLGGAVTVAEEAAGIPADIIKELDWLVGTWKAEGKVGDEMQTGGFTCRWAKTEGKKKVTLIGRFSYTTGDETRSGITLVGWNAAKRCIEDRGFDDLGGNAALCWTVESATLWRGNVTIVQDGQTVTAKADLVKKGPSEFVYEAEMDNGDVARIVFRKVKKEGQKVPAATGIE
jgi:hypothetical protein